MVLVCGEALDGRVRARRQWRGPARCSRRASAARPSTSPSAWRGWSDRWRSSGRSRPAFSASDCCGRCARGVDTTMVERASLRARRSASSVSTHAAFPRVFSALRRGRRRPAAVGRIARSARPLAIGHPRRLVRHRRRAGRVDAACPRRARASPRADLVRPERAPQRRARPRPLARDAAPDAGARARAEDQCRRPGAPASGRLRRGLRRRGAGGWRTARGRH